MRSFFLTSLALLGLAAIIGMISAPKPAPYTYADYAMDEARECVRKKGFGNWRGSMGITLEKFCEAAGKLSALEKHRAEHPEQY